MAPIAIATMMEHIGDMSAISATVGENFLEDPGLHRTLIGDGLATSFSALIGGPANTTYGENTGVLELSRVHDPKVVRLAAVYAIVLSFIPKFAQIIATMPYSIIGGVSFILYAYNPANIVICFPQNHNRKIIKNVLPSYYFMARFKATDCNNVSSCSASGTFHYKKERRSNRAVPLLPFSHPSRRFPCRTDVRYSGRCAPS